jgi:hypothetical protein
MKRLFTILFATMLAGQALAYDFQSGDLYYNITSDSTVEVTYQYFYRYDNYSGVTTVVIPETVTFNGIEYSVISIGDVAFYRCSSLTSIYIPNSITAIGGGAFVDCRNLQYSEYNNALYLGNTENPYLALINAQSTDIISCVINSNCKLISYGALSGCSGLATVTIPNSVTSIGSSAFSGCSGLTSVTIPNSVTSIGIEAFGGCSGLTSINIPNSVTSIGSHAFSECRGLTSVTIPNSVTSIGIEAFYGCNNIDYNLFDNAYYIGNEENPYIILMQSKTKNIEACEINSSCLFINAYAFNDCNKLTEITIPESILGIDIGAFGGCYNLKKAKYASIESLCQICNNGFNPLYYAHNLYINNEFIQDLIIPDKVTHIGDRAFAGGNFQSVTIPNTIKSIGEYAFLGCSSLTSVTIPNSVIGSIGHCAFDGCYNLVSVSIGNGIDSIGEYAFNDCGGIKTFIIGCSVQSFSDYAFSLIKKYGPCSANLVVSFNYNPPTLVEDLFSNANTIFVPAEAVETYKSAPVWKRKEILPFYRVKVTSADITTGTVQGDSLLLGDNSAIITAIPTEGYHFVKWSDGNTDNPRSYSTKRDTSFTAIFESHTVVADAAVAATATESGLTEGSHCSVCGKIIVAQEVIPALGGQGSVTTASESAANTINIYAHGKTIVIENATEEICVYDAMGALVGRDAACRVRTEIPVNGTGVYIVKTSGVVKRVMVN